MAKRTRPDESGDTEDTRTGKRVKLDHQSSTLGFGLNAVFDFMSTVVVQPMKSLFNALTNRTETVLQTADVSPPGPPTPRPELKLPSTEPSFSFAGPIPNTFHSRLHNTTSLTSSFADLFKVNSRCI
jgi:hypothetical protein